MIAHVADDRPPIRWDTMLGLLPRAEVAAWGLVLLLALLLRLIGIADPPLSPDEGRRALEGLTLFREWRVAYEAGPLLPNLLSLVFGLFTPSDGQARLPTALAGTGLVLVPRLLRPVAGGRWSLATAAVLAASPPLVTLSRTVSPAIFSLCFLALTVACGWRFGQSREQRWLVGTLAAVLLGLASDPSFTVGLGGLALAYAIAEGDLGVRGGWLPAARASAGRAALIALGVAVLASTRLLMNPIGIQAGLIDPLWAWTADLERGSGLRAPLIYALEDGGTLLLALIGLTCLRRLPRPTRFLGAWLLVSLTLASLMRQPDVRYLFQPSIPAALLAGLGLVRVVEWLRAAGTSRAVLVGLAALVPLITAAFQVNAGLRGGQDPWTAATIVAVAGLCLVGLLAFNILTGEEAQASLATFALVLVLLGGIAGASRWAEARGNERGQLVETALTTPEIRRVREEVRTWYRADPGAPIPVDATLQPLLAWSLRDVPTVRYDADAATQPVARVLANPPSGVDESWQTERLIVGYAAEPGSLTLRPARLWPWLAPRQSLVSLRAYAIVLVQPASR